MDLPTCFVYPSKSYTHRVPGVETFTLWYLTVVSKIAPSKCPNCGSPAYVGFNDVECTSQSCDHYHKQTFIDWALEMYAEENETQVEVPFEVEAEPSTGAALKDMFLVDDDTGIDWANMAPASGGGDTEEDIDEEADTTPGTLAWCQDIEADLREVMLPFGTLYVFREAHYDGIRITLYNPPTDCYVSEAFDIALLNKLGDGVVAWLEDRLVYQFPRELSRAWEQKMNDLHPTLIEMTATMQGREIVLNLGPEMVKSICIGDRYAMGVGARPYACIDMDRLNGTARFQYDPR